MDTHELPPRLSRRQVLKWFAAATAASQATPFLAFSQDSIPPALGYGSDPKVTGIYKPGDFWSLTLSSQQRKTVTALVDVILPADDLGPAASLLRVPDFIDEWVSAPYPKQQIDQGIVLPGLKWIDEESDRRFNKNFADLNSKQQQAICDDLCKPDLADPKLREAASFFHTFTSLSMGAYYSTPEGWKAIGYVGNTAMATFDGPPKAILDKLGLEQTVKS
ncbi:MAG: gluconate 2-dehydrogenase subunit 3 family protein [Verrucomicrobia bacterium]|nr:gluconate 2-dehydrogenase subunit 3 family protein [Verrucomicrobiota bacterium]